MTATVHYLTTTPTQRHTLDAAGRETDINAVLHAARDLHELGQELTETQRWNVTRILGRDAARVLAAVGDELAQVTRYEDEAAGYGDPDGSYDPDERAAQHRSSARNVAVQAMEGR